MRPGNSQAHAYAHGEVDGSCLHVAEFGLKFTPNSILITATFGNLRVLRGTCLGRSRLQHGVTFRGGFGLLAASKPQNSPVAQICPEESRSRLWRSTTPRKRHPRGCGSHLSQPQEQHECE
jgi:hypothetical protein